MTLSSGRQPAIALVDDDFHSARLMMRMLAAHSGPHVEHMGDPEAAWGALVAIAQASTPQQCMVVVDLKSSSTASRDFILQLKRQAPGLLVVAMAPSLDRETRNMLLDAGAAAVFERHSELNAYRREAANIVGFWVRSQRLDAVGT
jgi:DNA-binding NarL/FixJ family response regulator